MKKRIFSIALIFVILCTGVINTSARMLPLLFNVISGSYFGGTFVYEDYIYAPSKNEGVYIIDAKNPADLKKVAVAECEMPADRNIIVADNYLYAQDNNKVIVFDVSKPTKPKKVAEVALTQGGYVAANKDTLVVAGPGLLQFYDIKDPKEINLLSTVQNPNSGWYYGITMNDTHVYYIDSQFKFTVVDYTNRSEPKMVKQMGLNNRTGFADVYCPILIDNMFYGCPRNEDIFYIIDISDPLNPVVAKEMSLGTKAGAFTISGSKAYVASIPNGSQNLLSFDVVNKTNFKQVNAYHGEGFYALCINIIKDRYIIYNDYGAIRCFDMNGSIDVSGMPAVPNESAVLGGDEETVIVLPFEDVNEHWAETEIAELYNRGIVEGVSPKSFEPEREINRAEFCTLLVKMLGTGIEQYKGEFADVKLSDWYSDVIYSCVSNGLLTSSTIKNRQARPTEPITREEMAAAVEAAFEISGIEIPADTEVTLNDTEEISDWAKDSVLAVCKSGVMVGDDTSSFNPQGKTTRAEAAAVVSRLAKALWGETEEAVFLDDNKFDIADNIETEFSEFTYIENMPYDTEAPQIIRVSDAISPDELFNIYGEGLEDTAEVYIMPTTQEKPADAPDTKTAVKCEVVGFDEEGGEHYIVCKTPDNIVAGSYFIWVKNEAGFSKPVYLNGARPQWIDREEAAIGQKMRILGRNLDAREFDAHLSTSVAFVKDGKGTNAQIVSINPYCIEVIPPEGLEEGEYSVAVTNDGALWFELEDDKTIYIKNKVEDPFNLEMPWADKFDYTIKADITQEPYNAPRNGVSNVSHILQQAIDDVKAQGGGIVYIPEGKYKVAAIDIPADVIVMGDGMEKTILEYSNVGNGETDGSAPHLGNYLFHSKDDGMTEGRHGIYKLQITLDTSCAAPDHYIWFGPHNWGPEVTHMNIRGTKYIFVKEIKLNMPMVLKENDGRAYGSVQMIESHYLMKDCIFYGSYSTATTQCVGKYAYMINTHTSSARGNTYVTGGRVILEGNTMNRYTQYATACTNTQGMFFRDHAYVTENVVRGTGIPGANDGELFCAEIYMGGTKLKGMVASADAQSITFDSATINTFEEGTVGAYSTYKNVWSVEERAYNDGWYVVIANGKGMGQYRRVKAIDRENSKIILDDRDWNVLPDETSLFAVVLPLNNVTIYNNYANTGAKGCWLFGDCWDSVVAKNNLIDVEGAWTWTSNSTGVNTGYFNRFDGNKTNGYSNEEKVCGIGVTASMETDTPDYVFIYGTEIKNNCMIGGEKNGRVFAGETEAPPIDGIYFSTSIRSTPKTTMNTLKASIAEGNIIKDMETGITVGQDSEWESVVSPSRAYHDKIYCKDNSFENVKQKYVDKFNTIVEID